ncbi:hypothetical protein BKD30_00760 [Tersicoccus phoenicis]|uniref:Uncharacterized protein n=1 Tax=Tersicoccus phoenicis TaxID=554083 RepID=A0A1R1LNY8_9MICC|nr:hypothetical protein [Tersicoccus phoenicis]OMH29261.1 hypothetical protein BKD30_00760 [Tersicoccus phoenicis]
MMNDELLSPDPDPDDRDGRPVRQIPTGTGVHEDLSRAVRFGQVTQEQADRFERQLARLGTSRA